ncbi:hypothetical protein LY78DRAFT_234265 [Colletotrichum sublineola]|nr:hypothetical protein LY78DRAFT_234265 [Colletotrichum sublineola]
MPKVPKSEYPDLERESPITVGLVSMTMEGYVLVYRSQRRFECRRGLVRNCKLGEETEKHGLDAQMGGQEAWNRSQWVRAKLRRLMWPSRPWTCRASEIQKWHLGGVTTQLRLGWNNSMRYQLLQTILALWSSSSQNAG